MTLEMRIGIIEEIRECETAAELLRLVETLPEQYLQEDDVVNAIQIIQAKMQVEPGTQAEEVVQEHVAGEVTGNAGIPVVVPRAGRKYKLLKKDVSWTTKPQVHAIMAILSAHMEEGETVDEADIIEMMVANEAVLRTRQGGKRIWNYYKGDHTEGLMAHGNVERI